MFKGSSKATRRDHKDEIVRKYGLK